MNRLDTVKILELVGRALAKGDLVPVFKCFMFDTASVQTYDGEIGILYPFATDAAFALHGTTLMGLLQNSHSTEFSFKQTPGEVVVKAGKSVFKLPYLPKADFDFEDLQKMGHPHKQDLPLTDDVRAGMEACLLTVARSDTQGKLTGICVNQQGKFITLYSCDGDAITRYVTKARAIKGEPDRMMPTAFCEHVLRIFNDTEAVEGKIQFHDAWVRAYVSTGYRVFGQLLALTEPYDFVGELDASLQGDVVFVALPEGLDQALSRARVIADPESAKTVLALDGKQLTLLTTTHAGTVRDVLPMVYEPVEAHVSAGLIQRSTSLAQEIAVLENCTVFKAGDRLLQVLGNMST